jgi:hypothetical protein
VPNERVVEIPWALSRLPQSGRVLDVGSCDATYLVDIQNVDRQLECLDPRDCEVATGGDVVFHRQSLFGNTLPRRRYDAVLLLSVLEHLGLPTYGQKPFPYGDYRALGECGPLLRSGGRLVATVPAGRPKLVSWYRQYSPEMIDRLFSGWSHDVSYWGFVDDAYVEIPRHSVTKYDYRDLGAGALAGIVATPG